MRPHPSRAVEPTWLSRAQSDFDRRRAAERDAEHCEWMREAEGRRLYREHRDAAIAVKQRQLRDLPTPPRRRLRKPGLRYLLTGMWIAFWAALFAPTGIAVWLVMLGVAISLIGMNRLTGRMLNPSPRSRRVVQIGSPEREGSASGSHYHGDVLCHCDRPKACCDQGLLVWPLLCPWHPSD